MQQWLVTVFAAALGRESLAYTGDADLLRGQLAVLRECDVLDDEAHAEAVGRLDAAIEDARRRASFDVRPAGTSRPPPAPIAVLRRVIAVAQPLAEVDGMPFVLTSVELWNNRVDLLLAGISTERTEEHVRRHEAELNDWARRRNEGRSDGVLSPPQLRGNRLFDLNIRLRDDLGTSYRAMGGSAGGSKTEWRLHRHYQPGVPPAASVLTIEIADREGTTAGTVQLPL